MDAFFASVEQRDDPALRGRPVLVGGDGGRGVVCAASYESRPFGCRSAMPMAMARRLCPQAVIVRPSFEKYRVASERVFLIFDRFTPLVEPLSIDEAFLDVTGSERLHGDGVTIAAAIRRLIRDEVGLTASVGVAPNKFLAKLASDLRKPDGLAIVDSRWIAEQLPKMPVRAMWGVGPALEAKLVRQGITTFADLASASIERLERLAGSDAERLRRLAFGQDEREIVTDRSAKSIGQERTFGVDLSDPASVRETLLGEVESIARRLRRAGLAAARVTVKIRFGDFQTITRSTTLEAATDRTDLLWNAASTLFDTWSRREFAPVRLIGAALSSLGSVSDSAGLFTVADDERRRRIDRVADRVVERFGADAIRRAGGRKAR